MKYLLIPKNDDGGNVEVDTEEKSLLRTLNYAVENGNPVLWQGAYYYVDVPAGEDER